MLYSIPLRLVSYEIIFLYTACTSRFKSNGFLNQRSRQILCGEFVVGHLAALTVHWTVIHYRSAVRFAHYLRVIRPRAHNPTVHITLLHQCKKEDIRLDVLFMWLRGPALNQRPSGYEPDELPNCSTPRYDALFQRLNTITL